MKKLDKKVKKYLERAYKIVEETFIEGELDKEAGVIIDRTIEIAKMIQREETK